MIWSRWLNHLTTSLTLQKLPEILMYFLHVVAVSLPLSAPTPEVLAPHTRRISLMYLLLCNLQPSWLLYTRLGKWEETRMLWSRWKLQLSVENKTVRTPYCEGAAFCLHHCLGDAIQGEHVLLATISLLLCPCQESLIKEFLLILFYVVLDWFSRSS